MQTYASWDQGWSVVGDDNFIGVAYGDDQTIADNMSWDFEPIEDDTERKTEHAALLHALIYRSRIVDTEHLSGLAIDITDEFDWTGEGSARGLYTLKSEDTGDAYVSNADDIDTLVKLMNEYSEEAESDDDSDQGS